MELSDFKSWIMGAEPHLTEATMELSDFNSIGSTIFEFSSSKDSYSNSIHYTIVMFELNSTRIHLTDYLLVSSVLLVFRISLAIIRLDQLLSFCLFFYAQCTTIITKLVPICTNIMRGCYLVESTHLEWIRNWK